jgi:hypothetical protein
MGAPSTSLATLRPELAAGLMEFDLAADRGGFIGAQVMPVLEVQKQAGPFGKLVIEQLLHTSETKRAPGAPYSRSKWVFGKDSYSCEEHGHEETIDDRESAMYADFFNHEQISAMRGLDVVLRNAEIRIAAAIFNATTWTGSALTTAPTNEWDDATNAVPITDVKNAKEKVFAGSGLDANTLIINKTVFTNLKHVAQILDRVKYNNKMDVRPGNISMGAMAQALDIDRILIAGSPKNAALEGQSVSIARIWSNEYAMVCRIATTQDPREACIGRVLHWAEDGSTIGGTVETYRDETVRGDVVRVRHDVDEKVMVVEAGHLLSNITT